MFVETISQFLEVALPPSCLACYRALGPRGENRGHDTLLCEDCIAMLRPVDLARACSYCGVSPHYPPKNISAANRCSECEALPASFVEARSAYPYDSPAGAIVRNMKYQRAPYLAKHLVEYSAVVLDDWLKSASVNALVAAVPMSVWRQIRKGTNQAEELAAAVAAKYDAHLMPEGVFLRVKTGSPQARFHSRAERVSNVADLFLVKRPDVLKDAKILLVDDVMTTGATVSSAARALVDAGAREVHVYTPVRARLGEDADDQSDSVRLD